MKTKLLIASVTLMVIGLISATDTQKHKPYASSDQFKVIKVNGKILFQTTKSEMKTGDYFVQGTPLSFATQQSRAAIINKEKGRFILKPATSGKVKILPAANNVSSRAGALINMIDVQNHFSGDYLIIGKAELEINPEAFPQDDNNFFYLTYQYNGEVIRKKLSSIGNKLILDKNEIFKIDGEAIPVQKTEMTLFYRQGKTSKKINNFTPVFPDENDLKVEVDIILSEYGDRDNDVKKREVNAYLTEFYGKPNVDNLNSWLEEEFKIK